MRDQFYLHFDSMPKGTSQQKGYNRYTGSYYKKTNVARADTEFGIALKPHRPKKPSEKPIKLTVWFAFDTVNKKLWGKYVEDEEEPWKGFEYKPTRPDTDNYIKEFKDVMTKLGFWKDDAQVVDERIIKTYAEKATIMVRWEEIL